MPDSSASRPAGSVVVVDDDADSAAWVQLHLQRRGYEVRVFTQAADAIAYIRQTPVNAVISDIVMPGAFDGVELCARLQTEFPDLPVVLMTASGTLDSAIRGLRAGAYDYVLKPVDEPVLMGRIAQAVFRHLLSREVAALAQSVPTHDGMVGEAPSMVRAQKLCEQACKTDAPVLILGESGTGKELMARRVHDHSPRADGPFVAINCAAIPENLLESELFGHVKGAFTGAQGSRRGLFQQASGGTLFLDEIGDMPVSLQPKLLRALELGVIRPVGGEAELQTDVRIVSATHRTLDEAVTSGAFRQDLFYRINVFNIALPSLRERGPDILTLAQHFLHSITQRYGLPARRFSVDVAERFQTYGWPGNVRELRNCVERAVTVCEGECVRPEHLPDHVRASTRDHVRARRQDLTSLVTLQEMESRYIAWVLQAVDGNKRAAAQILGIDRKTLYRKLPQVDGVVDTHAADETSDRLSVADLLGETG